MKRLLAAFLFAGGCLSVVRAEAKPKQILLIPLDDRPVCRQLPEQIGALAAWRVAMPPRELLGGVDTPGDPDKILDWLEKQPQPEGVIVSADMVAYGGLISSREARTLFTSVQERFDRLDKILDRWPETQRSMFGSLMRVSLTSTPQNASWRLDFLRFVTQRSENKLTESSQAFFNRRLPSWAIADYDRARQKHHQLNRDLVERAPKDGTFLLFGQDDAASTGPHVSEVKTLREDAKKLDDGRVQFVQGVDQLAALLVSRTILRDAGKTPAIRIFWSNERDINRPAPYESEPLMASVAAQIQAAGMRLTRDDSAGVLMINAPGSTPDETNVLLSLIDSSISSRRSVAVTSADTGRDGVCDARLAAELVNRGALPHLASFSAWNTASNAVGTAIAGLGAELADGQSDLPSRITARRDHLFSRLLYDWIYHDQLRPQLLALTDEIGESRDRLSASGRERMEPWLQDRMAREADRILTDYIVPNAPQPNLWRLQSLKAGLPWNRPFEVEIELEWRS